MCDEPLVATLSVAEPTLTTTLMPTIGKVGSAMATTRSPLSSVVTRTPAGGSTTRTGSARAGAVPVSRPAVADVADKAAQQVVARNSITIRLLVRIGFAQKVWLRGPSLTDQLPLATLCPERNTR